MSGYGGGGAPRVRKVMTQAINLIFEFLKNVRIRRAGGISCINGQCRGDIAMDIVLKLIINRISWISSMM